MSLRLSERYLVTPTMRLYLPRVKERLRGITALWFCRKKGHLHTTHVIHKGKIHSWLTIATSHNYMNKALHHPDTIKVQLRNQNKRRTPNATKVPDRPQLGSTTDRLDPKNTKDKIFIELLLSLVASSARTHRHLQAGFGSICEPQGLSNLAPSRSRLFKLMGKVKV